MTNTTKHYYSPDIEIRGNKEIVLELIGEMIDFVCERLDNPKYKGVTIFPTIRITKTIRLGTGLNRAFVDSSSFELKKGKGVDEK